jgi:hypothetical protein
MVELRGRSDPGRIGRFSIIGVLGTGGFGRVYVAGQRDRAAELVAVKVMLSPLASDPRLRKRFEGEIAAVSDLTSEYVPRLKDYGLDSDVLWLATDLVRGPSLHQVVWFSKTPLTERTVRGLGLCLAAALRDIHAAKLVHRDFKPGNVLLARDGPRIIDFGLAHLTDAAHQTASGQALCSPDYAPPEQRRQLKDAVEPADVFTLGGTLLYAATGHPPFSARRPPSSSPPKLSGVPDALYDVIAKCLHNDQELRPTVAELVARFEDLTGISAAEARLAFASALTDEMVNVMDAWQRELEDVLRRAAPGPGTAGIQAAAGSAAQWPALGMQPTMVPTDAQAPTGVLPGNRDRPSLTVPMPAPRPAPAREQRARPGWSQSLGDWIRAPAAATNDQVVAASLGGLVAVFAAGSGNDLGKVNLGVPVRSAVLPPWSLDTGLAYASGADGVVYAIDLAAGAHWPLFRPVAGTVGPPVAVGDYLYALTADGRVWEINPVDARDADLVCELHVPALGLFAAGDGKLVAATAAGTVYLVRPDSGRVRPLPVRGLVFGAPAAAAGWLYTACADGRLWSTRLDETRDGGARHMVLDIGVPVHAAPVHDRGRLYVGASDGKVRVFSVAGDAAGMPKLLWTSQQLRGEVSGIAVRDGTVMVAAGRSLSVLDGAGHHPIPWSARGLISGAPALTDDFICVTSLDGTVSRVDREEA